MSERAKFSTTTSLSLIEDGKYVVTFEDHFCGNLYRKVCVITLEGEPVLFHKLREVESDIKKTINGTYFE